MTVEDANEFAKLTTDYSDFQRDTIKSSPGRWFVLLVFCMVSMCQAMTWMLLGPSSREFTRAYGNTVDSSYISWATNAANISFLLFTWPNAKLVEIYGPSFATRFSIVLTFSGCVLRCIPWPSVELFRFFMVISMLLIGIAGPWSNFGGPTMSVTWFPVSERITAQAIASVSTFLGGVAAFIIGPAITVDASKNDAQSQMDRIFKLYYLEAAIALITLIGAFVYFPDQPEFPPSISAAVKRKKSFRVKDSPESGTKSRGKASALFPKTWSEYWNSKKMRRYLYLNFAISLPLGLYQGWSSILDLNLQEFGVTTVESSWLGCWMTLSGCLASIIVARYMDQFSGKLKTCCVVSLSLAAIFMFWFTQILSSMREEEIASKKSMIGWLYMTIICTGFFTNVSIPLQFELVAEAVFGVLPESMALAVCTITNTVLQIIFLALPTKINGSSIWMNWTSVFSVVICLFMLVIYKVDYSRLEMDTKQTSFETEEDNLRTNIESAPMIDNKSSGEKIGFWFDRFGCI